MFRNQDNSKKKTSSFLPKLILRMFISFCISIILVLVIREFFVFTYIIPNQSMEPNFLKNKKVFITKNVSNSNLFIGNIVLAKVDNKVFLARIVAKPGDRISIENKKIFRNGNLVSDKFAVFNDTRSPILERISKRDQLSEIQLNEKHYFLLIDNRDFGFDSREIGPISIDSIIGKVWF